MVADNTKHLTADEVEAKVREYSPALANCLRRDRSWVWYCGPSLKNHPKARAKMLQLGFRFAKQAHEFADGTVDENARWFHPCGGAVFRRKRDSQPQRSSGDSMGALLSGPEGAHLPEALAEFSEAVRTKVREHHGDLVLPECRPPP